MRLFVDQDFQNERVKYVKNPIVKAWWLNTYAAM
jgi:hypothetical protein